MTPAELALLEAVLVGDVKRWTALKLAVQKERMPADFFEQCIQIRLLNLRAGEEWRKMGEKMADLGWAHAGPCLYDDVVEEAERRFQKEPVPNEPEAEKKFSAPEEWQRMRWDAKGAPR